MIDDNQIKLRFFQQHLLSNMEGFGSIVVSIQYPVPREEVGIGCHVEGQSEVPPGAAITRNLHQMKTTHGS